MSWLLRLVPEPWVSIALALAALALWTHGRVTGSGAEAARRELVELRSERTELVRQRDASLDIQVRMAERLSALRLESREREEETERMIDEFRKRPVSAVCTVSDSDRLRLQSIRIGPARTDPSRRR